MNAETVRSDLTAVLAPLYGAGEAASMARIVLEDGFGIRPGAQAGRIFSEDEQSKLQQIRARLLAGEPIQYVLGKALFFGYFFKVDPYVLIPRQETEELVDWVLSCLKKAGNSAPTLLDIGLGSGCIGISLKARFPGLQLYGLEKSPAALSVALENAGQILGDKPFHFLEGDILHESSRDLFPALDVVVSNPPYIPRQEENWMPDHVLRHEPALALFVDHEDSLLFYRVIAAFALEKLRPGGALFFECNEFNASQVVDLLADMGFSSVELRADISGADRMVMAVAVGR